MIRLAIRQTPVVNHDSLAHGKKIEKYHRQDDKTRQREGRAAKSAMFGRLPNITEINVVMNHCCYNVARKYKCDAACRALLYTYCIQAGKVLDMYARRSVKCKVSKSHSPFSVLSSCELPGARCSSKMRLCCLSIIQRGQSPVTTVTLSSWPSLHHYSLLILLITHYYSLLLLGWGS